MVILFGPIGLSICSVGSGLIMKRTGRYVALGITSVLLILACVVILTTLDAHSPKWPLMIASLLLAGLSTGGIGDGRLVHLGPQMSTLAFETTLR